jgi:hypothetical protein
MQIGSLPYGMGKLYKKRIERSIQDDTENGVGVNIACSGGVRCM